MPGPTKQFRCGLPALLTRLPRRLRSHALSPSTMDVLTPCPPSTMIVLTPCPPLRQAERGEARIELLSLRGGPEGADEAISGERAGCSSRARNGDSPVGIRPGRR